MKELNPWDRDRKLVIGRPCSYHAIGMQGDPICTLERGVNYFVLMLEKLGAKTTWSCEGHPDGFYISFVCDFGVAVAIASAGHFTVEVGGVNNFTIRKTTGCKTERRKRESLRWAATAWEKILTPRIKARERMDARAVKIQRVTRKSIRRAVDDLVKFGDTHFGSGETYKKIKTKPRRKKS